MSIGLLVRFLLSQNAAEVALRLIRGNVAAARKEPGNVMFHLGLGEDGPVQVTLFEVYRNEAALTEHQSTEAFRSYKDAMTHLPEGSITNHSVERFTLDI